MLIMKKILSFLFSICSIQFAVAQNVGIGIATPAMPLHVRTSADSAVVLVDNATVMNAGTNTGLYFKNGAYFSGAVKTIGTSNNTSRLGLFGYAVNSQNSMREYLSILDDGSVGIGTIIPGEKLTVNGTGSFTNADAFSATSALTVNSASPAIGHAAINSNGAWTGVQGGSSTGTGVSGYSGLPGLAVSGTGVLGQSSNGIGVYGFSQKSGSYSVYGRSMAADIAAAYFVNAGSGKALMTNGAVQIMGQGAGAGKVLTSDATGNATWQAPLVDPVIAFSAYKNSDAAVGAGSTLNLSGFTSLYNDGGGFNTTNGNFIAPEAGVYQFTVNVAWGKPSTSVPTAHMIEMKVNGNGTAGGMDKTIIPASSQTATFTTSFTGTIKLSANAAVSFSVSHSALGAGSYLFDIYGTSSQLSTTISGFKVK